MSKKAGRVRRLSRLISGLLIGLGAVILVASGAVFVYGYQLEQQVRADPWLDRLEATYAASTAVPAVEAEPTAVATPTPLPPVQAVIGLGGQSAPKAFLEVNAGGTPEPVPTPTATARPVSYPAAVGVRIRSVGIESKVVEFGVKNGLYEVPKFFAGHYVDSANPGQRGNVVFSGHVESFNSGNVFASLPQLRQGALIELFTSERVWQYRVTQVRVVPSTDVSVMKQTDDFRVTLITCTGAWDYLVNEYEDRLIVVAQLTGD